VRLTSLSIGDGKKGLERKFTTGRGGETPSDLKFTTPLECKVFSGGLREPSHITHQLGKSDLKPKSMFSDTTGSHPFYSITAAQAVFSVWI
jgi:hypothetical protein